VNFSSAMLKNKPLQRDRLSFVPRAESRAEFRCILQLQPAQMSTSRMDSGAVEICDLPVVSLKQDDAGDAIVDACKSHGFFVLQDHSITLIEELFAQSKAFFDLPRDTKNTIKAAHTLRGYSAPGAEVLDPENQTGFESKVSYSNESKAA
jgi:non-haem dioxygenase in morphine synthesis N-terminal